ncbi:hypothetical protein Misp01_04400 [Microtetraspora sp. NBRC 13810]|nr:hypothetical protein Misp01_04400 [Microtetraspora sp. NBRC 13810]
MAYDAIQADYEGRNASGRRYLTVAQENEDFIPGMHPSLNDALPVSHEEITGPYLELQSAMLEAYGSQTAELRFVGAGQLISGQNYREVEDASRAASAKLNRDIDD